MPARTYKSFRYKANTTWSSARRGTLTTAGRPNIVVGSPPEFKREGDVWAPEELLVGSLNTCMMLTFLTLAQARGLSPIRFESEAEGLLENVEGKYRITEVTVRPRVVVESDTPTRACAQDHGRRRGSLLHFKFDCVQGEARARVCRRSCKRVKGVSRCRSGDGYREMEWNSRGERRVYWPMVLVHIIYALWLALVVYLSVSAIGAKGEPQAHLGQSLGLLFAIVAAFALPHLPFFSFVNFAPANAVASTIGFALCVAGMAFDRADVRKCQGIGQEGDSLLGATLQIRSLHHERHRDEREERNRRYAKNCEFSELARVHGTLFRRPSIQCAVASPVP